MRFFAAVLFVVFALGAAGYGSLADSNGFSGHASLSLQARTQSGEISLAGDGAFERRGSLMRFDLLTLSLANASKGSQLPSPVPPGGYSLVYDTSTMVYTVWAPSRRKYYTGKGKPSAVAATPTPTPTPAASSTPAGGSLGSTLAGLKDLRQFSMSLSLSPDKTAVDGHPTTNFDFKFTRQVKGQEPTDVLGRASFADDLGGVPVLLVVNATNGTSGNLGTSLRATLTNVKQSTPPQSDFAPPPGYTKGSSILDVITLPAFLGAPSL